MFSELKKTRIKFYKKSKIENFQIDFNVQIQKYKVS